MTDFKVQEHTHGFTLPSGARIVHQVGANNKTVFSDLGFPVVMHELSANLHTTLTPDRGVPFAGQIGLIDFDTSIRLPRHVHIAPPDAEVAEQRFVAERILVLAGTALVELNAEVYVIPPRTLVTIPPGVPHTWTACPKGVSPAVLFPGYDADMLAGEGIDKCVSEGKFLMVYEYEEETGFFPTKQTETMTSVSQYVRAKDDELEALRFPEMSPEQLREKAFFVWGKKCGKVPSPRTS